MPRPDISVSRPAPKSIETKMKKINLQQLATLPVVATLLGLIVFSTSATSAIISGLVLAGLTVLTLRNVKILRRNS